MHGVDALPLVNFSWYLKNVIPKLIINLNIFFRLKCRWFYFHFIFNSIYFYDFNAKLNNFPEIIY